MKNRTGFVWVYTSLLILFTSACATPGGSTGTGAGAGVLLGAGVGALADPGKGGHNRIRNVLIGTAIGGVVGAGTGFAAHQFVKEGKDSAYQDGKAASEKENSEQIQSSDSNQPRLLAPKTEARWIPDQIRGTTFIPGHFEYTITQGARWESTR